MLPNDLYWQEERVGRSHRAIVSQTLKAASSDMIEKKREEGRGWQSAREEAWGGVFFPCRCDRLWGVASHGARRKRAA